MNKKKRYKKGDPIGEGGTFLFTKEVIPHYFDSGRRLYRRAFFQCIFHRDTYYKITFHQALRYKDNVCPCGEQSLGRVYDVNDVKDYSYQKEEGWHKKALRETPAQWFRVTRMGIFLRSGSGKPLPLYRFPTTDRKCVEYRIARKIENIIWNRPKARRAFYLMRLSHEYDSLHRDGEMVFESELWNRGAGIEFFDELLTKYNIT